MKQSKADYAGSVLRVLKRECLPMSQEFVVITTRGRLRIAADSQSHANDLARSDGYELDFRFCPFTEYESDLGRILGSIQQEGHFIWATDTRCPQALKDMINNELITFKGKTGILATYIPLQPAFDNWKTKGTDSLKSRGNT